MRGEVPVNDPVLRALFAEEAARHAEVLARPDASPAACARALHAVRGAAAMLGLSDLAQRLGEAEQRARGGDAEAVREFLPWLVAELERLGFGRPPTAATGGEVESERKLESDGATRAGAREAVVPEEPRVSSAPGVESVESVVSVVPGVVAVAREGAPRASREGPSVPPLPSDRPSLDPDVLSYFFSEARTRVERFGEALAVLARAGNLEALDEAFMHVHSVKGAASTVGLLSIARAAHALEGALQALRSRGRKPLARELEVLASARVRLASALAEPGRAGEESEALVRLLQSAALVPEHDVASGTPASAPSRARPGPEHDVIRVPVTAVASLSERVGEMGFVGDRLAQRAAAVRDAARSLGEAAEQTLWAVQRIGPPRPWGAPAEALDRLSGTSHAMGALSVELEREADRLAHDAGALGSLTAGAREGLERLGATSARWLFDRVAPAAEALARSDGKHLMLVRVGEETLLSRALAERLVEPLAQLARNAVAHGVEAPTTRLARGKPARATLRLCATADAGRLYLQVEDDGAGVDVEAVAARALAMGALDASAVADRERVLSALFLPGLSTRLSADASAGRGVGLDLVARELGHLGGRIVVRSTRGRSTRFEIDIPMRPIARRVLVVLSAGERFAVPLERVRSVGPAGAVEDEGARVCSLAEALGDARAPAPARERARDGDVCVWLDGPWGDRRGLRVSAVERAREFVVKPLPALVAGLDPYAAAAVDGEGRVMLVLDVDRLWG